MTKRQYDATRHYAARMLNAMRGVRHLTRTGAYMAAIEYLTKEALSAIELARDDECKGRPKLARDSRALGCAKLRAATLLANRLSRLI